MTIRSLAAEAIKVSDSDGSKMIAFAGRDRAVSGGGIRSIAAARPGLQALLLI